MSALKRIIEDEEDDIWDYKSSRKIKSSRDSTKESRKGSIIAHGRVCKQTSSGRDVSKKRSDKTGERLQIKRSKILRKPESNKNGAPSIDSTDSKRNNSQINENSVITPSKNSCSQSNSQTKVPSTPRSWERPPVPGSCPHCQMPFQALTTDSPRWHVMECMDQPFVSMQGMLICWF